MAGKRLGRDDPRDCLEDFERLVGIGTGDESPYIMENVASRLINAPWSERFCAADFGDVTSRRRWFYSQYLLHVVPTPGPRRIRDIRDHDEDERVLRKRGFWTGDEMQAVAEDDAVLPSLCSGDFHGTKNNGSGNPTKGSKIRCKAGQHRHYDDTLDTLQAHSWHGHDIRGSGKLIGIADDGVFGSLTADAPRAFSGERVAIVVRNGDRAPNDSRVLSEDDFMPTTTAKPGNCNLNAAALKLGLRGNSASASASAFDDDEVLGSILSNSFHGNEASKLVGCRNPSILEMARSHSIPDSFDWAGATKTDRGKLIANSVPAGMAQAVCLSMLRMLRNAKSPRP